MNEEMISSKTICFTLIGLLLASCQSDYRIDLWNGYKITRSNSHNRSIIDSWNIVVVPPNITRIGFRKPWVIGSQETPISWFILNTETNECQMFGNLGAFEKAKVELGIRDIQIEHRVTGLLKL